MYKLKWIFAALYLMVCCSSFSKDFEHIKAAVSVSPVNSKEGEAVTIEIPKRKILKSNKVVKIKRQQRFSKSQREQRVIASDLPRGNSK